MDQCSTTHTEATQQQSSHQPGMQHNMPCIAFVLVSKNLILTNVSSTAVLGHMFPTYESIKQARRLLANLH